MPLTDAFEIIILDGIMGDPDYTPPTNWFVGLSTTTPTEAGANFTEPVGNGYARVSTADADWDPASGTAPAIKDNANAITFPQATGSWGTVTHFGLFDASTGGNLRMWGALATAKAIANLDTAAFAAAALVIKLGKDGDTF
jgi:hypothetical protein